MCEDFGYQVLSQNYLPITGLVFLDLFFLDSSLQIFSTGHTADGIRHGLSSILSPCSSANNLNCLILFLDELSASLLVFSITCLVKNPTLLRKLVDAISLIHTVEAGRAGGIECLTHTQIVAKCIAPSTRYLGVFRFSLKKTGSQVA